MARKKITPKEYSEVATGVRLSSHEKLCAERMNHILKALEDTQAEVKALRADMNRGKGAISVLVLLGSLVAAITVALGASNRLNCSDFVRELL